MNNNTAFVSAYPLSLTGPEQSPFLKQMVDTIRNGEDPFEAWASFKDIDDQTMSEILGCSLHTYTLHKMTYGNLPFSPLKRDHVLRFCLAAQIHPTDLSSDIASPEEACAPHIFEAIKYLSKYASHEDDKVFAEVGLNRERARYENFAADQPDIAGSFYEVERYIKGREADSIQHAMLLRKIGNLGSNQGSVASVLKECFGRSSKSSDLSDPRSHIEDYHAFLSADLEERKGKIPVMQYRERHEKYDIKVQAQTLFGRQQVLIVMHTLAAMEKLFTTETDLDDQKRAIYIRNKLLARFPLNRKVIKDLKDHEVFSSSMSDAQLVHQFTEHAMKYLRNSAERELIREDIGDCENDRRSLEAWLADTQSPELFFMQYLYCNHAYEARATGPLKLPTVEQKLRVG